MKKVLGALSVAVLGASLQAAAGAGDSVSRRVLFNRDVRPILSDKCFLCHGPDATSRNIPLRLDLEESAKADLGGRRAIVPGNAGASELIRRITSEQKSRLMPPVHSGLKLTNSEIETLRLWIEQGAEWQLHWSFIPPQRPSLPKVSRSDWPRNAIDYFILARLDRENLTPSPEAPPETLLRRASYDVTGLPPTPAELDAFLNDRAPDAWERAVDRLLASPRYGERMAFRWMEYSRYADTNGYQFDGPRQMWRWRDWVIDAFNRNLAYDRFVIEQIAGDMLPNATLDQIIATGFNRNHRGNTEDGIVPEEYAVEYVADRLETTSTVFLGLTMGCARCHNHKYDPFTQKEYYQLFAYFNNVPENGRAMKYGNSPPLVPAPAPEQQTRLREMEKGIAALEKSLAAEPEIHRGQRAWERSLQSSLADSWSPKTDLEAAFEFEGRLDRGEAHGAIIFAQGRLGQAAVFDGQSFIDAGQIAPFDIEDRFTLAAWVRPAASQLTGPIVTRMSDHPRGKGLGLHLKDGRVHFHLTSSYVTDALRVETEQELDPGRWHHVLVTYDGSRMVEGVRIFVNGVLAPFRIDSNTLYRPFRNAGRPFAEPVRIGGGWGKDLRFRGRLDDVRVWSRVLTTDEIESLAVGLSLQAVAAKPPAQRSAPEARLLRWRYLDNHAPPAIRELWRRLAAARQEKEHFERTFPTVMVMAESPVRKDTFFLHRGAYDSPGEKIEPGVPQVLPPLPPGAPNNRLGFAQWLVHPSNPLTARVAVNRFWQMYFGVGLVKTSEDFGLQGEWPSHPELLDWLATEFVASGWNLKRLQKLILTSATYRQSSKAAPELLTRDPDNRLLARGPRFRLPAEMVRDGALRAAGLLVDKLGGPSVMPYQPNGLWDGLTMQDVDYVQGKGEDLYRRSLYTYWKRTIAPPSMANFDAALRETCVVRTTVTNTPLQALNLMNDVQFVEAARFMGQRMLLEGGDTAEQRLSYGFRLVTSRLPSDAELAVLLDNLHFHRDYFSGDHMKLDAYLAFGESAPAPGLNRKEVGAYAAVASLMLNLDEALTKE
jgi:hypothetical protein